MNLSELESDETRSSDNPQLEDQDEEEALRITLAQFANPVNSGKRKRKRTERKEFYDVSDKYTKEEVGLNWWSWRLELVVMAAGQRQELVRLVEVEVEVRSSCWWSVEL
ncbi:hypothetical protein ACFE04_022320 [Oxalis oulophora]